MGKKLARAADEPVMVGQPQSMYPGCAVVVVDGVRAARTAHDPARPTIREAVLDD
jgi:hypothetical protein